MKKNKILSVLILFILTLTLLGINTNDTYANIDYEFEVTIRESTTSASYLTAEELLSTVNQTNKRVSFDIYIKSIGMDRTLDSIQAGWLVSNEKISFQSGSASYVKALGDDDEYYNVFTNASSDLHLALGMTSDAITNNVMSYQFKSDEEVKIAKINFVVDPSFSSTENIDISLDFVNYIDADFEDSYEGIKYDKTKIKVNKFTTNPNEPDASLKSLKVGQNSLAINNQSNAYEVELSYDESKMSLSDLIKVETKKENATYEITKSGVPNIIQIDDVITITVTDATTSEIVTADHLITIKDIKEANTNLKELGFFSDNQFTLNKVFHPETLAYEAIIPESRQSHGFKITPIAQSIHADVLVKLNNEIVTANNGTYHFTNLPKGINQVNIIISNNGLTKTYSLIVDQKEFDKTANLSELTLVDHQNNHQSLDNLEISTLNEETVSYRLDALFEENTVKSVSFSVTILKDMTSTSGVSGDFIKDASNLYKFKYNTQIRINKGEQHTITLVATSEDGQKHTYVYIIERMKSSNMDLSSVSVIEEGTTSLLQFTNNEYNYIIKNNNIDQITVLPLGKVDEYATVYIAKHSAMISGGVIDVSQLGEGKHAYEIVVAAQNGTSTKSYVLNIIRLSSDVEFSLNIRKYGQTEILYTLTDLTQTGNNFVLNNIPYIDGHLSLELVANHTNAKVEKTSGFGTFSAKANRITGTVLFDSTKEQTVVITFKVSAENANISENFDITLTRNAAIITDTLNELTISDQVVTGFTPDIVPPQTLGKTIVDPAKVGSTLYLDSVITNKELTTTVKYEYKLNTDVSYSSGQSISYQRGKLYDVKVTVTSQAGTSNVYHFQFIVASTNNEVSSIELYDEHNNPIELRFNKNTNEYSVNVLATVTKVNVKATVVDPNATLFTGADANGFISLNSAGLNTVFNVYATSESLEKGQNYKITIVRGSYRKSAQLETLELTLSNGNKLDLNPVFQSNIYNYTLRVNDDISSIDVLANVKNLGESFVGGDKQYSENIRLISGDRVTVQLVVVAEDGITKNTYTITILRANADASLAHIVIDGDTYTLDMFSNNILNLGQIPYAKNQFEISITASDRSATVSSSLVDNKWILLSSGRLETSFTITAQDKTTTQTFKITVNRESASNDASLASLILKYNDVSLLDGLTPSVAGNNYTYRLNVDRNVTLTDLITIPSNAQAKIKYAFENYDLNPGSEKTFTIIVTAEDGSTSRNYHLVISQKNMNNDIDSIEVNGKKLTFDANTPTYDLGTFYYSQRVINLSVLLEDYMYAKVYVNQKLYTESTLILTFDNKITIQAESEHGVKGKIYTLNYTLNNVNTDTNIDSLIITGEQVELYNDNDINKNIEITIPSDYIFDTVSIHVLVNKNLKQILQTTNITTSEVSTTEVKGLINLDKRQDGSIHKIVSITIRSEEGQNKVFTITFTRGTQLSSNKEISAIHVYDLDNNLIKTFDSFTSMNINVNYPIHAIKIVVELLDSKASHDLASLHFLNEGVINQIEFKVKAEDGTLSDKFVISVFREKASQNVYLSALEILDQANNNLLVNFEGPVKNYTLTLNTNQKNITINYEKGHSNQTVLGHIGEITLSNGVNNLQVFVIAEDGVTKNTYQIKINVLSDENEITEITLNDQVQEVTTSIIYDFGVVNHDQSVITLDFKVSDGATKIGNGLITLNYGANEIKIHAVSESGKKGIEYTVTIYRQIPDKNNLLSSITVIDSLTNKAFDFDQEFNPNNLMYSITLDPKTMYHSVTVDAVLESNLSKVNGLGTYTLKESNGIIFEIINLTVEAQNGDIKTYQVKVMKVNTSIQNDQYEVEDISLYGSNNQNYFENLFNKDKEIYEITLPYEVTSIQLDVLLPLGATLQNNNNQKVYHLIPGVKESIKIQSIAQDGTVNPISYIIIVERQKASTYQNLDSLIITEVETGIVHNITDLSKNEITVIISKEANLLDIFATTSEHAVIISGIEEIDANKQIHHIFVKAEDNSLNDKIYTIIIQRVKESEVLIDEIIITDNHTADQILYTPIFSMSTTKYLIDLTNSDTKEINITANLSSLYTSSTGLGIKVLPTSSSYEQIYILTFTSEDGLTIYTYEIVVKKDLVITPNLNIEEISLIGNDGKNYLGYLNAQNQFKENIFTYEIVVPYQVTSMNLFIKNNFGAKLSIPSLITLNSNYEVLNTIEFYIYLDNMDQSNTYTLRIRRQEPSHINTLNDILIDGVSLDGFMPEKLNYELTLNLDELSSITLDAIKSDMKSVVIGTGLKTLNHGVNVFHITVTAEDGTTLIYQVKINLLSFDDTLYALSIKDFDDSLQFNESTYAYQLTVDYLVSFIEILTNQNEFAKVYGAGIKNNLQVGSNLFEVYVVSEANTVGKIYEIEIIRLEASEDATLSNLEVKDLNGNPINFTQSFNKENLSYIIYIEDESLMNVNINASATNQYAKVYNTGLHTLEALADGNYHHILNVMVIAQNGESLTYSISFYRNIQLEKVTEIESFNMYGSDLISYLGTSIDSLVKFDQNTYRYEIFVPHTTLSMNVVVGSKGNVFGAGQKLFNGNDEIIYSIYIESIDKSIKTQAYEIIVKKLEVSNVNTLKELLVNNQLIEGFDPLITNYEVVIHNQNLPIIHIDSTPLEGKVAGNGTYDLVNGKNYISINVTAENGDINTYTILVKYIDTNALLDSLVIKYSNQGIYYEHEANLYQNLNFDANTFEYTIYLEPSTRFVNLSGAAQNLQGATVLGFGTYKITNKEEKIFIHVSSVDQATTEIYTVNIIKEIQLSSNTQLTNLSVKNQDISFDPNTYQYKLNLSYQNQSIELSAQTFDQKSKVSIVGYEIGTPSSSIVLTIDDIVEGNNVILVKVEAEDGSIAYYRLNVTKEAAPNYIASLLLITAILLWAITVTAYYIRKVKKNNNRREGLII